VYPGRCQGFAGTLADVRGLQVPWPMSGVCRYPGRCQGFAGTLSDVRGLQVPWPMSGVCRYPGRCQGFAEICLLMPASNGRIGRCTFQQALARARTPPLISARRADIRGSVLARTGELARYRCRAIRPGSRKEWCFNGICNNLIKERTTPYKNVWEF